MPIFSPVVVASLAGNAAGSARPRRPWFRRGRAGPPPATSPDLERDIRRARLLAGWLDTRFSVLGYRFGLDGVLGLLPVAGDTVASLAGLYPLFVARRHRLGWRVQARMGVNVLLDWAIGLVPVLGDLFDVAFKSNVRNATLLEDAAARNH